MNETEWAIMEDGEIVDICTVSDGRKPTDFKGREVVLLDSLPEDVKRRYRYWDERP